MHVPKTADMMEPEARLALMDKWDVKSSILYIGNMISAISFLDDPKYAYPVLDAYNSWMYDQWQYIYKDRLFTAPIITLDNLVEAIKQVKGVIARGMVWPATS